MPKINENSKITWLYKICFFIILTLPILVVPPYFFPGDWGKSIIFRSILSIILFLLCWQILYKKNELQIPNLKRNPIVWGLVGIFIVFLLSSIFSVDSYFSFWGNPYRGGGFITLGFCIIFPILLFILFKKEDWRKVWIFSIFIGLLVSLIEICQYYGLFNTIFTTALSGPSSTYGNPILLALYLLMLLFMTIPLAISEQNRKIKIFYVLSALVFIFSIFISGSRASYLGVIVGMLCFLLIYPKKFKSLKISIILLVVTVASIIYYVNAFQNYPQILQKNRIFQVLETRLSIKTALSDERFRAWQTVIEEIKDKPLLGWGLENLSVGFDKNYNPKVTWSPWWDKAHNVFLQIGAESGILGIIAYIFLFIILFWQLHKAKKKSLDENTKIIITGIQAALTGYLVANFFSFDSFGTYLVLFLIIGYSLHLSEADKIENKIKIYKNSSAKKIFLFIIFFLLTTFLWQYNLVPLYINAQINNSNDHVSQKQCDQAFSTLDNILQQHSLLDSYMRMEYLQSEKTCSSYHPQNILAYTKKGLELLSQAVKIQPFYARYWIWYGNLTTTLASQETNPTNANDLIKQANNYYNKALQLAPKHQEVFIGRAQLDIVAGDYKKAQSDSKECIKLNSNLGDCYWQLGISEIYLNDNAGAQKDILLAKQKGYNTESESSLDDLVNAYGQISDYQDLAPIFEKLVLINPNNAQYRTYLNYVNSKLGK